MSCYRRCRRQYKWKYIDNLSPKEGIGRVRGSAGHSALAEWYRNGCDLEADEMAMKAASSLLSDFENSNNVSLSSEWELLEIILPRYFDWARANDSFEEILSIEQEFEIDLDGYRIVGFIDGVVKATNGTVWLLEHKFNKQVSTSHIDLDPQMSMYLWAAHKLGIEARGVLYNVIRVAEGGIAATKPVERRMVYRRPDGLRYIENEIKLQLKEMDLFHAGKLPAYRNPTSNCSWDCSFFNSCLAINDDGDEESAVSNIPLSQRSRKEKDMDNAQ